jgi:hypothetical protein
MSELFREPARGGDILTAFKRLMESVRRERLVAGDGILVKQTPTGKTVSAIPRGGMVFSGIAYIAGNKTTGLNSDGTKAWVRCFIDTATAEENAGPPPNPFPINEEWYEKAKTAGDIHIPRA